ncbi:MAG TPA: hypothetical protein VKA53_10260, partial [Thermoanaerobaculia bacterium]|nr:hypothetical protein [Thermoanaerobaculia bacterium]
MSGRRFFAGDSLEQAIMRAARCYELSPDEIAFDLVGKRHGFVKRRRRVILRVDPEHPRRTKREEASASPRTRPATLPQVEFAPPAEAPPSERGKDVRRQRSDEEEPRSEVAARRLQRADGALALAVEKCLDLTLHFLRL